jgi:hypothetical protein
MNLLHRSNLFVVKCDFYSSGSLGAACNEAEKGAPTELKRAKSAEHFLTYVLPEMEKSIESKDTTVFNKNFQTLTINCNNCHAMEKVPFFTVKIPTVRQSPIKK